MTEEILQLMEERQKYKELQSKIKLEIKIAKEQWMCRNRRTAKEAR